MGIPSRWQCQAQARLAARHREAWDQRGMQEECWGRVTRGGGQGRGCCTSQGLGLGPLAIHWARRSQAVLALTLACLHLLMPQILLV